MISLLFWIALIAIGIWLWRRIKTPAEPKQSEEAQVMVRCAHCELHIPQSEALERSGNWYCSNKHLELGPRQIDK